MANFQKAGANVNGRTLQGKAGQAYEVGLWGPIDVRDGSELRVFFSSTGTGATLSKGALTNNIRSYVINKLPAGRTTLSAKDASGLVWTTVTIDTAASLPGGPAAVNGKYTKEPLEVETKKTVPRIKDVWDVAYQGWYELADQGARVLTAQWAHETGFGASCYNYNLGNIKATNAATQSHMYLRHVWEHLTQTSADSAIAASGGLAHMATVEELVYYRWPAKAGKVIAVFEPPHPYSRFRAYASLQQGAQGWLDHHKGIWKNNSAYLGLLNSGDVAGVAHAMRLAKYYTGPESTYVSNMKSCKVKIDADLGPLLT
jgi:hypothetical protein